MKTILVIDDEPVIRVLLRQLLEKNGFTVIEAGDGLEGIRLFNQKQPDLVITDLIMPNEEGLGVIRALKQARDNVPIIAMSGGGVGSADIYLDLAEKMGAGASFEKPFDPKAVLASVKALLDQPES